MELISLIIIFLSLSFPCWAAPFTPGARTLRSLDEINLIQTEKNEPVLLAKRTDSSSKIITVTAQPTTVTRTVSIPGSLTSTARPEVSTSNTTIAPANSAAFSAGVETPIASTTLQSLASQTSVAIPVVTTGVCGGSARGCWGNFSIETDTETSWPETGRTVEYNFTLTNTTCSPDGVKKQCLLINNQFPGPTIVANWGDVVKVTVNNQLTNNGTSIHWHGIPQRTTNDQDGVSGVTECPIVPGQSRVYTWQATSYGTAWYHSHFSSQYGDGVAGSIVINGPTTANYDVDLGPMTLSELYNVKGGGGAATLDSIIATQGPLTDVPENILFNGTNVNAKGGGQRAQITVQPGMRYKMRFVNAGVDDLYKVGVDGHQLQVVAIDLQPVQPYYTQWVSIGVGQRFEAILTTNNTIGNYWLRAVPMNCAVNLNDGRGTQNAIISYAGAKVGVLPTTKIADIVDECVDEKVVPVPAITVDQASFDPRHIPVSSPFKATSVEEGRVFRWSLGNTTAVVNWQFPILQRFVSGNTSITPEDNLNLVDGPGEWAFFYIQNNFYEAHPLHMHGNVVHVLASGDGNWDQNVANLAFSNPPRRDTFMLAGGGYAVLAFRTTNPGVWLLHCHIAWHASEGLATTMFVRRNDVPILKDRAAAIQQGCTAWKSFSASSKSIFKQLGSGI